jgi:LysM repeat protein
LKQGQRLLVSSVATTPRAVTASSSNYPSNVSTTSGYHTAQSGDTVYNIARRYQLSPHNLIAINALAAPYHLTVGQVVRLGSNVSMVATNSFVPAPTTGVKPQAAMNGKQHVVRAGETLYSISRRYGYTPEEVAAWNRLPVPYTIGVGQVLLIAQPHAVAKKTIVPAKAHKKSQVLTKSSKQVAPVVPEPVTVTPAKTVKPAAKTAGRGMITPSGSGRAVASFHTVQAGESLESIAASYHITTHDLAIWNGIGKPYTVLPGKKLLIVPP